MFMGKIFLSSNVVSIVTVVGEFLYLHKLCIWFLCWIISEMSNNVIDMEAKKFCMAFPGTSLYAV